MYIEIHKRTKQLLVRKPTFKSHYYFVIVGDNHEPIALSETYTQKHNVTDVLKRYFPDVEVNDYTDR